MKKSVLLLLSIFLCPIFIFSEEFPLKDTLYTELKKDIVILSSTKETNSLKSLPAAVSVFSPKNLEALQITSLKDLSSIVPNYFAADYGSKMTAPMYIRGIGARSGDQTVSMYVDNVPYFNTTSFDVELFDIQRIEVLRGTQGTLYGRNAMGGIINIYTFSPLTYEGTTVKAGGGSYGLFNVNASHYQRINNKMGFSLGGYYRRDDGYFKNAFNGKRVDDMQNIGGRGKFVWEITPDLSATYSVSFDYVDQGAFPYANDSSKIIKYNSDGYYKRKLLTNGLALRYSGNGYEINSTTGYQYLNDEMNMDQDYTERSVFQINQRQKQNSISQEITVKSNNISDYQWSIGGYGFYDYLHTTPPVYMMKDGIQSILQSNVNKGLEIAQGYIPPEYSAFVKFPTVEFQDEQVDLNGHYKRPTYGFAFFHQSTLNNLLIEGLSVTAGLRLDYEKTKLDYDASALTNYKTINRATNDHLANSVVTGSASKDFFELLPKGVIKYQINPSSFVYLSASRGYKAGGHNIQMFADILQEALQQRMMTQIKQEMLGSIPPNILPRVPQEILDMLNAEEKLADVNSRISYKPEYSWNYELGGQIELLKDVLMTNFALYYMDVRDVQVTQFVQSVGGRMVTNAGKAESKGFEVGLKFRPCNGFYLYGNYGLADATFKDYVVDNSNKEKDDYTGNHIPYAPGSTFSVGGSITYDFKNKTIFDRFTLDANFAGVGKTYWFEDNSKLQGFYGTLNAHAALDKGVFTIELWGKNILDRDYYTFLFESGSKYYGQLGKPARFGASLKIRL